MSDLQIIQLENTDISKWDFSRLRTALKRELKAYASIAYTDASIKDAKKDRTTLNKAKKVIEDARKAYKARCLAPYEKIEPQIKELADMVENQRKAIDDSVKDYENRQKEAKEREVRKYYDRKAGVLGDMAKPLYPKLFDKKWVNASTGRAKYEEGIQIAIDEANKDIRKIKAMKSPFKESLLQVYVETLSMDAVKEKNVELTKAASAAGLTTVEKAADAVGTQNPSPVVDQQVPANVDGGVAMKIYATQYQMNQIKDFMKAIGVRYEFI